MSLRNKFATALLATTALVASNAQAGQTITNEDEVRALSASCEQAVIWYGDKILQPERSIVRIAQNSAKNWNVNVTTVAGNPNGLADLYICSGKSKDNEKYKSPFGTEVVQDAAKYQDVVRDGLSGRFDISSVINDFVTVFDGIKEPNTDQTPPTPTP